MSKAFTKEEDAGELLVVPRAPLPEGVPNYVTPNGLAASRAEQRTLERQRQQVQQNPAGANAEYTAWARRLAELEARLDRAVLVDPSLQPREEVRFGAHIEVETGAGERRKYQLVGVDEANAAAGAIAFTAPLARALLGKRVGDTVEFRTPRGTEELVVLAIAYDEAPEATSASR